MSTESNSKSEALKLLEHLMSRDYLHEVFIADDSFPPIKGSLIPDRPRIFFGLEGARPMQFATNGQHKRIGLSPGKALVAGRKAWHVGTFEGSFVYGCVILDNSFTAINQKRSTHSTSNAIHFNHVLSQKAPLTAQRTMLALEAQINDPQHTPTENMALVKALLQVLHRYVKTTPETLENRSNPLWKAVADYVEDNYDKPIDRELVARHFGIHPNHLSRLFNNEDESFSTFLTRIRMEHAARLLRRHQFYINETAHMCGYESASYFSKLFKAFYGQSPTQYKSDSQQHG
jgi:AraC-like DNA-binding protein